MCREKVVIGTHWLFLLLTRLYATREHIRLRSAIAVAVTQYDNDFCRIGAQVQKTLMCGAARMGRSYKAQRKAASAAAPSLHSRTPTWRRTPRGEIQE
jgi:hypothetical protein